MYVVAWRGESHAHLENTMEAVVNTPSWVPLIEIDTRLTIDGSMIAYHSPTMGVHGDPRPVSHMTFKEVRDKRIVYKKREYKIPAILDLLETDREFMFHVKRETDIDQYLYEVDQFPRPAFFHSNSDRHLEALSGHMNSLGIFKSIYKPPDDRRILPFVQGYMLGHKAFVQEYSAIEDDDWLAQLRSEGKHLVVFAGATERWMSEVVEHDVDAFLTSRFDRAEKVLGALGYDTEAIRIELSLHLPLAQEA